MSEQPETAHRCSGPLVPVGDGWYYCPECGLRYHLPSQELEVGYPHLAIFYEFMEALDKDG